MRITLDFDFDELNENQKNFLSSIFGGSSTQVVGKSSKEALKEGLQNAVEKLKAETVATDTVKETVVTTEGTTKVTEVEVMDFIQANIPTHGKLLKDKITEMGAKNVAGLATLGKLDEFLVEAKKIVHG